jgi:hypothetical protein
MKSTDHAIEPHALEPLDHVSTIAELEQVVEILLDSSSSESTPIPVSPAQTDINLELPPSAWGDSSGASSRADEVAFDWQELALIFPGHRGQTH